MLQCNVKRGKWFLHAYFMHCFSLLQYYYFLLFCSIIVIRNGKEELKEMEPEEKEKDAEKSPTVS